MGKRKGAILVLVLMILVFLFPMASVFAETSPINPDPEQTVVDETGEFELDSYRSYVDNRSLFPFSAEDVAESINGVANLLFSFNKIIFTVIKTGIDLFSTDSIIDDHVATFSAFSVSLYETLWNSFGKTIIVLMAVYVFYLFMFKGSKRALRQFLMFGGVLVLSFGWNMKANEFMRWFDTISNEVQSQLVSASSESQGTSGNNATVKVKNTFFNLAVKEPYYLMNYGVAASDKINTIEEPDLADSLLVSEGEEINTEKIERKVVQQSETNSYLTTDSVGWKFSVAALSPVMTTSIGFPLLTIQVLNFLLKVIALAISAFVGLSLFLSLIPRFHKASWNIFKTILGTFGIRVLLGLVFTLLVTVINVIRAVVPTDGVANYVLQVGMIVGVIYLIWKFKDKIVYLISGGAVASIDGGLWKKATAPIKNTVKNSVGAGVDVASMAMTGVPVSQFNLKDKMMVGAESHQEKKMDRLNNVLGAIGNNPDSDSDIDLEEAEKWSPDQKYAEVETITPKVDGYSVQNAVDQIDQGDSRQAEDKNPIENLESATSGSDDSEKLSEISTREYSYDPPEQIINDRGVEGIESTENSEDRLRFELDQPLTDNQEHSSTDLEMDLTDLPSVSPGIKEIDPPVIPPMDIETNQTSDDLPVNQVERADLDDLSINLVENKEDSQIPEFPESVRVENLSDLQNEEQTETERFVDRSQSERVQRDPADIEQYHTKNVENNQETKIKYTSFERSEQPVMRTADLLKNLKKSVSREESQLFQDKLNELRR